MHRPLLRSCLCALFAGLVATTCARGADRSAREILADLDAIKPPALDPSRQSDAAYMRKVENEYRRLAARQDVLIFELLRADPDNERLASLLPMHWRQMNPFTQSDKLVKEIDEILARTHNEKIKLEALFTKAQLSLIKARESGKVDMADVEKFIKQAGKDERSALLLQMCMMIESDDTARQAIEERILKEYPDSGSASSILGARRQREAVGKPFEMPEFTDVTSGSTISMKNLKGKVVVIDFWATWCPPCVAEMPSMKKLYAEYHDRGVEFIGVSLDNPKEEGGLDDLKKYVKENEIRWPQYYQGKGWESEFSRSWGINALPAMFVVDAQGKLYSVEARGKLDKILPKLLGLKDAHGASPAAGE